MKYFAIQIKPKDKRGQFFANYIFEGKLGKNIFLMEINLIIAEKNYI